MQKLDCCIDLSHIGLYIGEKIEVLSKNNFGLVRLKVRNSRVGLDECLAFKIFVKED
ncbi:FeoA domain protein [compost metagenome]